MKCYKKIYYLLTIKEISIEWLNKATIAFWSNLGGD